MFLLIIQYYKLKKNWLSYQIMYQVRMVITLLIYLVSTLLFSSYWYRKSLNIYYFRWSHQFFFDLNVLCMLGYVTSIS